MSLFGVDELWTLDDTSRKLLRDLVNLCKNYQDSGMCNELCPFCETPLVCTAEKLALTAAHHGLMNNSTMVKTPVMWRGHFMHMPHYAYVAPCGARYNCYGCPLRLGYRCKRLDADIECLDFGPEFIWKLKKDPDIEDQASEKEQKNTCPIGGTCDQSDRDCRRCPHCGTH